MLHRLKIPYKVALVVLKYVPFNNALPPPPPPPPTYPHKFSNGPSLRALEWTSGMGTKFRQNPFGLADTNTVHYVSSFINIMSGI